MYNIYHLDPDFRSITVEVSDGTTTVKRKEDADFKRRFMASIVLNDTVENAISDFLSRTDYEVGRFKVTWCVEDLEGKAHQAEVDCDFSEAIKHEDSSDDCDEAYYESFLECYYDQIADEIERCTENLERD